jgi:hypothetical protein
MRKRALWLLALAVVVPPLFLAWYDWQVYSVQKRGLAFDGQSAIGSMFLAVGLSALVWLIALVSYAASWFKTSHSIAFRNSIEVAAYCCFKRPSSHTAVAIASM